MFAQAIQDKMRSTIEKYNNDLAFAKKYDEVFTDVIPHNTFFVQGVKCLFIVENSFSKLARFIDQAHVCANDFKIEVWGNDVTAKFPATIDGVVCKVLFKIDSNIISMHTYRHWTSCFGRTKFDGPTTITFNDGIGLDVYNTMTTDGKIVTSVSHGGNNSAHVLKIIGEGVIDFVKTLSTVEHKFWKEKEKEYLNEILAQNALQSLNVAGSAL